MENFSEKNKNTVPESADDRKYTSYYFLGFIVATCMLVLVCFVYMAAVHVSDYHSHSDNVATSSIATSSTTTEAISSDGE